MREHKANAGPAGPEASKKGWEGASLPRLGRKGKIVRNLLLTAVFAACIWGQYGYVRNPPPAATGSPISAISAKFWDTTFSASRNSAAI